MKTGITAIHILQIDQAILFFLMNYIYSILYNARINWLLRNSAYVFKAILPEKYKIHPSGTLKLKIEDNTSIYLKTNQTSYVSRQLFWEGPINYEFTAIFKELVKKVDVFYDIGSSIGYYSMLGVAVNTRVQVTAFEPSVGSMYYLSENIKTNNFSAQIAAIPLALSDKVGEVEFFDIRNHKYPEIYNLSGEHNMGTKPDLHYSATQVLSDTLDNYVAQQTPAVLDLIKIDTEGCEDLILKNASKTIEKYQPIIICETLFDKIETKLEVLMLKHGYEFYNHQQNGLCKVSSIRRTLDNGVRNCFFVHPSKKHLIEEFIVA